MATASEHIEFANRTQKTIAHLLQNSDVHSPWIAIAAFYKAVHIVEAVFASHKERSHSTSHDDREAKLKRHRRYEKIYRHYSPLKSAATNARYLVGCQRFDQYLTPQQVIDKLLKHHLHQLETSANLKIDNPRLDSILDAFDN